MGRSSVIHAPACVHLTTNRGPGRMDSATSAMLMSSESSRCWPKARNKAKRHHGGSVIVSSHGQSGKDPLLDDQAEAVLSAAEEIAQQVRRRIST